MREEERLEVRNESQYDIYGEKRKLVWSYLRPRTRSVPFGNIKGLNTLVSVRILTHPS